MTSSTRREILKSGLGIAGILASGQAPAYIKSLIAASNTSFTDGGWKNPYVRNGLIAMWDGEWNAGGGIHDPTATVWKDLCHGMHDLPLASWCSFGDSFVNVDNRNGGSKTNIYIDLPEIPDNYETSLGTAESVICYDYGNHTGSGFSAGGGSQGFPSSWMVADYGSTPCAAFSIRTTPSIRGLGYVPHQEGVPYSFSVARYEATKYSLYMNNVKTSHSYNWLTSSITRKMNTLMFFGGENRKWAFRMFNVRLYSRVLTPEEVAYNYGIDKERFAL